MKNTLDLKSFVSKALQQIMEGIGDAQDSINNGAEINPKYWVAKKDEVAKLRVIESTSGKWIHEVKFDVAVNITQSEQTKGGIGLIVGPVTLGSAGQSGEEQGAQSRIQFSVPVSYPEIKKNS